MKVFKIDITAWTSSFRYPNLISGFQPTLEVPPISTVLGLINAAAGRYVEYDNFSLGYYFEYASKQVDLETIYQIEASDKGFPKSAVKSNVINREFLYDTHLIIYVKEKCIAEFFDKPVYPLLLGRSNDLATVNSINDVDLKEVKSASKIKGEIVPFAGIFLPGIIQPLPQYFTNTIPRNNIGTEAYSIIGFKSADIPTKLTAYVDYISNGKEIHVYFHELNFTNNDKD